MQFASQRLVDVFVAAPVGRIDHPNAERLQRALAPILDEAVRDGDALVIDFSHVEYISSMGLRVLLMAARQLRAANARIAVAALQPVVPRNFPHRTVQSRRGNFSRRARGACSSCRAQRSAAYDAAPA